MQTKRRELFTTIRTEGAILPPDLLQRIADGDPGLKGLSPDDYHLPGGEKLNEAINRSWNRMLGAWATFQGALKKLPEQDLGTTATRERWLLPLFQELGYGRLLTAKAFEMAGKTYPISHAWQHTPIHLVGCRLELDRRVAGVAGAARSSPHSLLQEFLNRSDDHLWGFVSNGLRLRILRDNVSLTRQAYVDFDLESMMQGEVYSDFVLLWLLCHQSRVEAERPEQCWLEKWSKAAQEQGTRALDQLRDGVAEAISALGRGFLTHPANKALREKLQSGDLPAQDYYRQLLRMVYRLLFLFVAEERRLLLDPKGDDKAKERYRRFYSTERLRRLAERRRGTKHADLWEGLRLVMDKLGSDTGCPELALPPLGSFLWSNDAVPDLVSSSPHSPLATHDSPLPTPYSPLAAPHSPLPTPHSPLPTGHSPLPSPHSPLAAPHSPPCHLANRDLLAAIRALAFTIDQNALRPVDYKNLGSEELGSVYESLLELHPEIHAGAGTFELRTAAGSERKTTGSYYTPDSLVQCLLDSALEPVIEERLGTAARVARSEWRVVSEEMRTNTEVQSYVTSVLPGLGSVATRDDAGRTGVQSHPVLSEGRAIWDDVADSAGSRVNPSQHRRGVGEGDHSGVSAVPSDRQGQPAGAGDPSAPQPASGPVPGRPTQTSAQGSDDPQQATGGPESQSETEKLERLWAKTPLATRHSLLAQNAILGMRVCDPACGSGHFLVAAAHRMAKRLAGIREGVEEPSPEGTRAALRDIIGRCIYGVDINPMAVELCKVSLWMEALEPGKPLSFLDHHIQCGNSLLGATPALLKKGIPDEAFKPIEGDDKEYCKTYKKRNKEERAGQEQMLFDAEEARPWERLGDLATELGKLDQVPDSSIEGIHKKQERYEQMVKSTGYKFGRLWADAWCAAFVWKKTKEFSYPITEGVFRKIEHNPHSIPPWMRDEIQRLAKEYQFFHWHLAFPDVFRPVASGEERGANDKREPLATHHSPLTGHSGGFDVVLGNPPWEHTELKEKEWFAERRPKIAQARTGAQRKRMITALKKDNPSLYAEFSDALREHMGVSHFLANSGCFALCGRGRINLYAVFAEGMRNLLHPAGRAGCILPTGIATDDTTKFFFQDAVETKSLGSLFSFENEEFVFPEIHHATRFCLFTAGSGATPLSDEAEFVFFARQVDHLRDPERRFTLSAKDIALLNPNTRTCPIFRFRRDAELTKAIYRRVPVLIREAQGRRPEENPWGIRFKQGLFNMTSDSHLFRTREELEDEGWRLDGNIFRKDGEEYLPLYEAKMIHHFDHRWGTYEGQTEAQANQGKLPELDEEMHKNPFLLALPHDWLAREEVVKRTSERSITGWMLGFRGITGATVFRTVISCVVPRVALGNSIPLLELIGSPKRLGCLLSASLNSFATDFCARFKVGGSNLNFFILKQFPAIQPDHCFGNCSWSGRTQILSEWLLCRVMELTYTAWDLEPFALDCLREIGVREIGVRGTGIREIASRDESSKVGGSEIASRSEDKGDTAPASLPPYSLPPFIWDEERRFLIRCELDAAFFHLYLGTGEWRRASRAGGHVVDETEEELAELKKHFPTPRDAVDYIMDTFPIVKRKDEKQYGEYRTKRVILEIYDEMAECIAANGERRVASGEGEAANSERRVASGEREAANGERRLAKGEESVTTRHSPLTTHPDSPLTTRRVYHTRLSPPPGPPTNPDGTFAPLPEWLPGHPQPPDWPPHIHPPKEVAEAGDD